MSTALFLLVVVGARSAAFSDDDDAIPTGKSAAAPLYLILPPLISLFV